MEDGDARIRDVSGFVPAAAASSTFNESAVHGVSSSNNHISMNSAGTMGGGGALGGSATVAFPTGVPHTRTAKHHASAAYIAPPPSAAAAAASHNSAALKERSASTARLLRRLVCCSTRIQFCLRSFGFLKDEENTNELVQLLVCSCAAVAALLVLLLVAVGFLIVVFVVIIPDTQWQLRQTMAPYLDFNNAQKQGQPNAGGYGTGGKGKGASPNSPFDVRRILAASGIKDFLQQAHRAEELRLRAQRNETLLGILQRRQQADHDVDSRGTAKKGDAAAVDLVSLARTLPQLERLSGQLLRVSAYVQAVHAHDPRAGLVELSDFLLNVKGRAAALRWAAAQAKQQPAAEAAAGGHVHGGVDAAVALKAVFAGRGEAARLRGQLRGFVGVPAGQAERWTRRPFDDVALLQYRHAWTAAEVVPRLGGGAAGTAAGAATAQSAASGAALKADVYEASSIFNHVYYYPLRRYTAMRAFAPATVADTDAWYSEVAAGVQACFGAAAVTTSAAAGAAAGDVALRVSPLSSLALPRLPAARAAEVAHLLTAGDAAWMPAAQDAGAAVNRQTIFISLASYRDMECSPTVLDLFRVARNPYRVYVGLAQQNRAGDTACVLPEMYGPLLCAAAGAVADAHAAAREAVARRRSLRDGVDLRTLHPGSPLALFDERVCFLSDHVRVRDIDSRQAKGPTYGRYMAMLLYRGEDLTLVLDSHNKFRPMWDTLGVSMLDRYQEPKAALSHYPEAYAPSMNDFDPYKTTTAYLCKAFFMKNFGYPRLNGIVIGSPGDFVQNNKFNDAYAAEQSATMQKRSSFRLPQPWIAGGFLFTYATVFRDVPFDPHLPYVFDGEEVLYSVRLWTHGYNIYSPPRGICYHIYGRAKAPKVWSESALWYATQDRVRPRIQFFLQSHKKENPNLLYPANATNAYIVIDSSRYGMGKQRTVPQWYAYAGADPVNYTLDGKWCGVDTTNM